jgi:nucleotidyltransferase AbiEii toxin of type IV toxin-antitoxin system
VTDFRQHNLGLVATVARRLGDLGEHVVFVGGATTSLFITDPGSSATRPTRDVDVVVEVGSLPEYHIELCGQLRARGFTEDTDQDAPLCRWVVDGVRVDVMPANPVILGFSNRWYPAVLENFTMASLPAGPPVRLVTAPYFLGTKLEAFLGRGRSDYQGSHDLEDIVTVVDGRKELVAEVRNAEPVLKSYFQHTLGPILRDRRFQDALPGHLMPDAGGQARLPLVLERLEHIAGG